MKIGDKVVMNDKYRVSEQNKGKIWTVHSEPWDCCGTTVVLLKGKSGGYAVDGLIVVEEEQAMERLTKRIDGHVFYTQGRYETTIPAEMETEDIRQCLKSLAAYEDTGLEPEEILAMLERADIVCENVAPGMRHLIEMCKKIERERDAAVKDLSITSRDSL